MLVCYMWHVLHLFTRNDHRMTCLYIYIYIHTGIGTSYLIIVYWLRIMVFYPIIYTLKYGKHTVTFTFLQASRHQIQHLKFKTHSCVICIYIYIYVSLNLFQVILYLCHKFQRHRHQRSFSVEVQWLRPRAPCDMFPAAERSAPITQKRAPLRTERFMES